MKLPGKLTWQKPNSKSKRIDSVYINHTNAFREAGHAQSILPNLVGIPKPIGEKHIQNIHLYNLEIIKLNPKINH